MVSAWHSGIPELVRDGVSGLLAPERDIAGLASHLLALIEHPELLRKMGHAGHDHVCGKHNIEVLNDRLEALFCKLADDVRSG